jgi:hypothetical protein
MAAATKKKKRKEEAYPWKAGASSTHITNLKQSIWRLSISMGNTLIAQLIIPKKFYEIGHRCQS